MVTPEKCPKPRDTSCQEGSPSSTRKRQLFPLSNLAPGAPSLSGALPLLLGPAMEPQGRGSPSLPREGTVLKDKALQGSGLP